jgi:hypothetical protein
LHRSVAVAVLFLESISARFVIYSMMKTDTNIIAMDVGFAELDRRKISSIAQDVTCVFLSSYKENTSVLSKLLGAHVLFVTKIFTQLGRHLTFLRVVI